MKSKEESEQKRQRIINLHNELIKSIFEKIPILEGAEDVYLPRMYFDKLTDEEFVVLWAMPNLVIRVNAKAADYIEDRRKLLGLRMDGMSGVLKGREGEN